MIGTGEGQGKKEIYHLRKKNSLPFTKKSDISSSSLVSKKVVAHFMHPDLDLILEILYMETSI